jgi:murein DD-endopeptidase MepM/ murein hydrolase activator NlpD
MMGRRAVEAAALLLAAALLVPAALAAVDPGAEKARVDDQIGELRGRAADASQQAGILTEELSAVAGRVRSLQSSVETQQARLATLEGDLTAARTRLSTLDRTITEQTERLERLRREYQIALARLERRVRELYMSDSPDALSFVLGTSSFTDIIDNLELLGRIGRQDERIATQVKSARDGVADARRRTRIARAAAAQVEAAVAAATSEQRTVVTRLVESRDALVAARLDKSVALASIQEDRESVLAEIEALEQQSAELAERIRQAQQGGSTTPPIVPPSGNGLLGWPVSGPVTSGFGPRWGRMHEGIDIAVSEGTPVRAAAAGTVIHAGWLGGYGNLVVVDHGGGLSTAYAHNSSYASSVGEAVAAGQVVAYSGNTGNSSGPHVHFEVRVNGSAVDPLGYL